MKGTAGLMGRDDLRCRATVSAEFTVMSALLKILSSIDEAWA